MKESLLLKNRKPTVEFFLLKIKSKYLKIKTMLLRKIIVLLSVSILLLWAFVQCEVDQGFELGDTVSDFEPDSLYITDADGLLFVQINANVTGGGANAFIIGGGKPSSTDTLGQILNFGSVTIPLKKDTYWKVHIKNQNFVVNYDFQWTPFVE